MVEVILLVVPLLWEMNTMKILRIRNAVAVELSSKGTLSGYGRVSRGDPEVR